MFNKIKKRVRFLRNKKLQKEAEKLNQFANKRGIENLFRTYKEENHAFKYSKTTKDKCDPAKLKQYFHEHFRNSAQFPDPKELDEILGFVEQLKKVGSTETNTLPPNENEIKKALCKLKNRKAANDIP